VWFPQFLFLFFLLSSGWRQVLLIRGDISLGNRWYDKPLSILLHSRLRPSAPTILCLRSTIFTVDCCRAAAELLHPRLAACFAQCAQRLYSRVV
jgi:hypothetical protein